jgi:hypothetical protein
MNNLKPNEKRAQGAIILIWSVMTIQLIYLFSNLFEYLLLKGAANGLPITEEAAKANDFRQLVISLVFMVGYIVSVITFIQWFRRAYYNLHLLVPNLNYTEGWASGAWFVPILNLFRPFQIMKELYEKTHLLLIQKNINYNYKYTSKYMVIWWTLWIVINFADRISGQISKYATTIDDFLFSTLFTLITGIFFIPLSIFTVKVIRDYSLLEKELTLLQNIEVDND